MDLVKSEWYLRRAGDSSLSSLMNDSSPALLFFLMLIRFFLTESITNKNRDDEIKGHEVRKIQMAGYS